MSREDGEGLILLSEVKDPMESISYYYQMRKILSNPFRTIARCERFYRICIILSSDSIMNSSILILIGRRGSLLFVKHTMNKRFMVQENNSTLQHTHLSLPQNKKKNLSKKGAYYTYFKLVCTSIKTTDRIICIRKLCTHKPNGKIGFAGIGERMKS